MATVIDELVLRLGLDSGQFDRSQQEFQRNLRRVQDETGTRGKDIEAAGNKIAQSFHNIRNEVIALAATILGVRGIREFAQELISNEAAVGRWAKVIGMSTEDLSAWGGAAERAGGSMEATTGTLNGLMQQFQQFALTGQSAVIPYFRALGVQITDTEGKMRPMGDILLDLAEKFHAMAPERAESFGTALGLDQGTINLLIQGRQAVEQYLEAQRKMGVTTKEQADSGQRLINDMKDLHQVVSDLGRAILLDLSPDIEMVLTGMRDWIIQNKEWAKAEISEKIRQFSTYIQSIDWKAVGEGIKDFFAGINQIVTALGGWERVTEAIFALWVGSKFTGVITAIALLGTRLLPITLAIAAIMAGWAAINSASENLNNPSGWSPGSPFWNGMSDEDQLKFANSPASQKRDGKGGSLFSRGLDWMTGGAPPAEGTPAGEVARQTHDFWRSQGLTEAQTAGVMANIGAESGFNPNAVGDNGTSAGLYQHHADRLAAMRARYGQNPTVAQQNEFAAWEISPGGPRAAAGTALRASTTPVGATEAFTSGFEAPANPLAGLLRSRQAGAYVGRYDGAPGSPAPVAGSRAPVTVPIPPIPPAVTGFGNTSNDNRNFATNSAETHINGPIVIQTAATDSEGIARGIGPALRKYGFAIQSNSGLA